MSADKLFNWLGGLTTVALATTLVASPNTARVVRELGRAVSNAFLSAQGRGRVQP